MRSENCYEPPVDLVDMFLRLSDKYGMTFCFGLYDSGKYWIGGDCRRELDVSKHVAEEAWTRWASRIWNFNTT